MTFKNDYFNGVLWEWQWSLSAHLQYQPPLGTKEYVDQVSSQYLNFCSSYRDERTNRQSLEIQLVSSS